MPGHSLHRHKKTHRYYFKHDGGFNAILDIMPNLHKRFFTLGSKHRPRPYIVGGNGNELDFKTILLFEAGVLEALQRWHTGAPNPVFTPTQTEDYDQATEIFNELIAELRSKPNRPGSVSQPWIPQPLPTWTDNVISLAYDHWLLDRATEFHDELILKPTVKQTSGYVPQNPPGSLGPVADKFGEILDRLTTAQP